MRNLIVVLGLLLLVVGRPVSAQSYQDVVHMKDGTVVRGVIVEQVPDETLTVRTREGDLLVLQYGDVERITKEIVEDGSSRFRRAGLESWYTYWGLGWVSPGYPGGVDPTIEQLRDAPGVSNVAVDLDLLGFYFPLGGDKTIVGGVINGAAERFEVEGETFQINQFLYSASVMHFFNEYIGRGFFARGDVGLARVVVDSSFGGSATSESGFGFLLGGGYAFQITRGTRLLLNANYARRSVEGESYSAFSLSVGGLF